MDGLYVSSYRKIFFFVQMAIQVNYVRVSKYIVDSVRLITLFLLIYQMIFETVYM
jgi:hypothetical protein